MRPLIVVALVVSSLKSSLSQAQKPGGITIHRRHVYLQWVVDTVTYITGYTIYSPTDKMRYSVLDLDVDNATPLQVLTKAFRNRPFLYDTATVDGFFRIRIHHIDHMPLKGKILDLQGVPLPNSTISVAGTTTMTTSNARGEFELKEIEDNDQLSISGVDLRTTTVYVQGLRYMEIRVQRRALSLPSITVRPAYDNGYQHVATATATGSQYTIPQEALERVISGNIMNKIAWQGSGLLSGPGPRNPLGWSIRGTNTLNAPSAPLLVVDGFVFPGRPDALNPNDIQSATILKDAAAASIWGTNASNGVMVLGSKTGEYKEDTQRIYTATISTTLREKPNLYYQPRMSSASYLDAERKLFDRGYYDASFYDPSHPVSPGLQLFNQWRKGILSEIVVNSQVSQLAKHNSFDDLNKYFYQRAIDQQYHLSLTGNGPKEKFYVSGGLDRDATSLVKDMYRRYTLHASYNIRGLDKRVEAGVLFNFSAINQRDNNPGNIPVPWPYAQLADASRKPLPVSYKYNDSYLDTAGGGRLMDWRYRPIDELNMADNRNDRYIGTLQGNLTIAIRSNLKLTVLYRFLKGVSSSADHYKEGSFFVRDLVNQFTQINGPDLFHPVPPGDIRIAADTNYTGHNLRTQLNYRLGPDSNRLTVFAEAELSDLHTTGQTRWAYGLDEHGNSIPVDFANTYPSFVTQAPLQIPDDGNPLAGSTRYADAFTNFSYSYHKRTTLYGSYRIDGSNIGSANHSQYNLYAAGGFSQQLMGRPEDTSFFKSLLKFRTSYGANGNASTRTPYLTTQSLGLNPVYRTPQTGIANPPDPTLRWEKTIILNSGFDFSFLRNRVVREGRISGSIDGYWKRARDLLGNDTLSMAAGIPVFWGNTAGINGVGLDLVLNTVNFVDTSRRIRLESSLLFSLARDWVSQFRFQPSAPASYVSGTYPMIGKPSTALFSYQSAGPDHATGDPQGYVNGKVSKAYNTLMNDPTAGMTFNGSYQPTFFGSLFNRISWRQFSLSARFSFEGGFFFRRSSVSYSDIANGITGGHKDYDKRWQVAGDEKKTTVPSFPATNDQARDAFYQASDVLIVRGDHLRCQDLRFSYLFTPHEKDARKWHFRSLWYLYVSNVGILWRSNRYGIDPDASTYSDIPAPRAWSVGVKIDFTKQ